MCPCLKRPCVVDGLIHNVNEHLYLTELEVLNTLFEVRRGTFANTSTPLQ